jgi:hypothetical protein
MKHFLSSMNIRKKIYNNYFTYGQYVVEPNTNPFPHFVRNRKNQLGVISVFGTMVQIPIKY